MVRWLAAWQTAGIIGTILAVGLLASCEMEPGVGVEVERDRPAAGTTGESDAPNVRNRNESRDATVSDLPQGWRIELPSRKEEPFASQHGVQTAETIRILPAKYQRQGNPILAIPLSTTGYHNEHRTNDDPQLWSRRYRKVQTEGFDALDPVIQSGYELGFREVWFWGFSGMHANVGGLSQEAMPWLHTDAHTPAMRRSWDGFVQRWNRKGVRFGVWLGGVAVPNFGSTLRPEHRWITRDDFDYVASTLAKAKALGFDAIGLDAFSWILSKRDMPEWARWKANETGPREPGIGLDLLQYLNARSDLDGLHVVTETRVPYGELLAENPTLFLIASRTKPRGKRTTIETLEAPTIENVVNPGHEIIGMLSTDGWTLAEYEALRNKLDAWGYRTAVNINVLYEIGLVE